MKSGRRNIAAMYEAQSNLPDCKDYEVPTFWSKAMRPTDPLRAAWIQAMQEEWEKLWKNGTYEWKTQEEAEQDPNYTSAVQQTGISRSRRIRNDDHTKSKHDYVFAAI